MRNKETIQRERILGQEATVHYNVGTPCYEDDEPCPKQDNDAVNHPSHYNSGNVETIVKMERIYGREWVKIFCILNAFKYRDRAGLKDRKKITEDIEKALWYEEYARKLGEPLKMPPVHDGADPSRVVIKPFKDYPVF